MIKKISLIVCLFVSPIYGTPQSTDNLNFEKIHKKIWQDILKELPTLATSVGVRSYDHLWSDYSKEGIQKLKVSVRNDLRDLKKINRNKLSRNNRLEYDLLLWKFKHEEEFYKFEEHLLPISQLYGIQHHDHYLRITPKDSQGYSARIKRLIGLERAVQDIILLLQEGIKRNITLSLPVAKQVDRQLKILAQLPFESHPFTDSFHPSEMKHLKKGSHLIEKAKVAFKEKTLPAFKKLAQFWATTYIKKCRKTSSWRDLPQGKAWYAQKVRYHTTLDHLSPYEVHKIGFQEVTRLSKEMNQLSKKMAPYFPSKKLYHQLKNEKQYFPENTKDLIAKYEAISKKANVLFKDMFDNFPKSPLNILPMPEHLSSSTSVGTYKHGHLKELRPATFYVNTSELSTRPLWEVIVLFLHEGIPGHHLENSFSQKSLGQSPIRQATELSAFSEGWALYAEKLGKEASAYPTQADKMGQLNYEMWRAVRLVVDTGIHAIGWNREQAINFFKTHTLKSHQEIEVEIDRYIANPGQALAYKIGELEISSLRRECETALKKNFSLPNFHREILQKGPLPLGILRDRIKNYCKISS